MVLLEPFWECRFGDRITISAHVGLRAWDRVWLRHSASIAFYPPVPDPDTLEELKKERTKIRSKCPCEGMTKV